MSSHSSAGGGCCQGAEEKRVDVAVYSARTTLALAGKRLPSSFTLPLPVFVPLDELMTLARAQLLDSNGRLYPCKGGECSKYAQEVYLESFNAKMLGGSLLLESHLTGHARWLFLHPGVTGNVALRTVPELVDGRRLVLRKLELDTETRNGIVKYVSESYANKLLDFIAKVDVDLQPYVDRIKREAAAHSPVRIGPACLTVALDDLRVLDFRLNEKQQGLSVTFGADLRIVNPELCATAKVLPTTGVAKAAAVRACFVARCSPHLVVAETAEVVGVDLGHGTPDIGQEERERGNSN